MSHRPAFYKPSFIMRSTDASTLRIIDLWTFRSEKSNKRYIVEVEYFTHHFLGLKFYWKGVSESEHRYSYLTNDYEPRRIILSCIQVMMHYYKNDLFTSFGFVAAPDLGIEESGNETVHTNKRFRFYKRMMLSLFGPETFIQAYDSGSSVYVMINSKVYDRGEITLTKIGKELEKLYEGEYCLTIE